ncbi:MAG: RNA repair transcriptional activator RtcR [Planctomycetia bacterium]|nr:RNA repair transcriptional activator RtcR [Planctomycetia bacterium]
MMKNVVYSHFGITLDMKGRREKRWEMWRPNVALCQQKDFHVDRLHLLVERKFEKIAEGVIRDIQTVSPRTKVVIELYECEDAWSFEEVYGYLYDLAERQTFWPEQENYFVHLTTGTHVAQICLFLLTEARHFPAKLLQTNTVYEESEEGKRPNPVGGYAVIDLNLAIYDKIWARFQRKKQEELHFLKSGIATRNADFNALMARIERVAVASEDPILIMGPTGAGKSQLARKIYELRKKRLALKGNFVEVNCATLRADTAMSTLFGHVKGAFTGADGTRKGLLCEADGGILFLDEIGELGLDEQAMLLHAIEEKRFLPMGADRPVTSSFQLLCGTNRNLKEQIECGYFREDLYARINLWTFELPALAERPEDIEPNVEYEIQKWIQKTGKRVTFQPSARRRFLEFALLPEARWYGNFRDLNAAVTRMGTLAEGGCITLEVVEEEIERLRNLWRPVVMKEGWMKNRMKKWVKNSGEMVSGMISGRGPEWIPEGISSVVSERITGIEFSEISWEEWERKFPQLTELDRFVRVQLADVLKVCRECATVSEASRVLFAESRKEKKSSNDADRLRKYLQKFGLCWEEVHEME